MPLIRSRYDGYAEWYDGWNQPHAERNASNVLDLLGPGRGLCLDLGCGCGHYFDALASTGRTVIGLDRSADQLRIARSRCHRIVQGDGAALPFADGTFPAVLTLWISTDVDDFGAVLAEAARVLIPAGCWSSTGLIPASTGRTSNGWTTAGFSRTPPIVKLDGIRNRRGGVPTCDGELECVTTRWPNYSMPSSPRN
jgi:ubiquinone/menaquinone biosynthesis C-methylase UbiE